MQTALLHRERILQCLMQGKRLIDIAPEIGISPQSISASLKSDAEYRAAVEVAMELRIDQAEQAIETAADQLDVARARARWQSAAWRAEREFPQRWGAKQGPTLQVNVLVAPEQLGSMSDILASAAANLRQLQGDAQQVIEDAEYSEVANRIDSPSPTEDGADGSSET